MPQQFFYKAMDNQGTIIQGQIGANNVNDLELRLERMGLDLIHYHTKRSRHFRSGKVSRQELITFCFHMENLTRAGVPLIDGLNDLRDSLPQTRFREIITSITESIQGGARLSEAMADFPEVFDQVFVTLIRTGEETGNLNKVFQHLTETLKWHDEMMAQTKKLLMYPLFMGVVITGVLFFIMMYLVPKLVTFVKSVGGHLPIHTQVLIVISDFFVNYWYVIVVAPILLFIGLKTMLKISFSFRFFLDRFKLRIWIIGPIWEKMILARFATFFSLLYGSGITVLDSLHITKGLANNLIIENALQQVIDNIRDGVSISSSFERVHLFPPLILRMVRVGEGTGELDTALSNVSYFYNREVKEAIERIQSLIEPMMTVILGLLLGWVVLSVLGPIYDTITGFQVG
jgi:type IV pilus assembly protein PilC